MTTMPAPTDPGTEKLIALVTNGSQFAGPAALLGLKYLNCQIYVHDPSFSDDAQRNAFESAHNGVIPACTTAWATGPGTGSSAPSRR